ncbi:DeoR family transcriptional regulator [Paenibacillus cellulositrophicus]|uniref:DeoR family transcriptional regulator n=1 Tax=Paenibacillus cellulositrophicus TaxID=562959 RepID=UPI00126756A1|nr:DeoR family transcriptional regulator [Paenibacillus cellulositrophicus]
MSGPPRRDLEKLEESRSVRRTYGGAIFEGKGITIQERSGILTVKKMRIGSKAAAIRLGESIFIDGGTTTLQIARHIPAGTSCLILNGSGFLF